MTPPLGLSQTRVVLVTDSMDASGMGHHMLTLAAAYPPGFVPHLAFPDSRSGQGFAVAAAQAGIACDLVPPDVVWRDWLAAVRPDIVHVHAGIGWEGHAPVLAGRALGLPVVRTEHLPWLLTDPAQLTAYARMIRKADIVVAVSGAAGATWREALAPLRHAPRLAVVANGIAARSPLRDRGQVREALGLTDDMRVILHVGRFTAQKAHRVLIDAFARLQTAVPKAYLIMVGIGETEPAVAAQVNRLGLARVCLLGQRDDVPDLLGAADLVVLPSLFEGLPLFLLEAMAAGVAVVATRIGGVTEALGADHRWLVEPGEPGPLARAMAEALRDPAARASTAAAQRRRQQTAFSAERMGRETGLIYRAAQAARRHTRQTGMAMEKINVGFVGAGGIAQRHLNVLSGFADVAIAGIADPDLTRAEAAAAQFGGRAFSDHAAMLDAVDLDALFICVPPFAHGDPERDALRAGVPFLVEKPLCTDLALAEEIAAEVARLNVITAVGYHWRYLDTLDEVRDRLAGNPAALLSGYWLDQTPPPFWWRRGDLSGGQMVEQATHLLDLARLVAGEVTEVFALATDRAHPDHSDMTVPMASTASLRFASGAMGQIAATCMLRWSHRVGLHVFAPGLAMEITDRDLMVDIGQGRPVRQAAGDPVARQDRDFIDAVGGGENRIRAPYAEALRTHRLALSIARSAAERRTVTVPTGPAAGDPVEPLFAATRRG